VAAPDIGALFPPSDPRWKGADSSVFVREALQRVQDSGYRLANIDASLILSAPKIGPHSEAIRSRVAKLLAIPMTSVGLKAKTPEGLGTEQTAIAHVVALIEKDKSPTRSRLLKNSRSAARNQ